MIKVITYGTFDLFHEGHYRILQRAKALGDYLIVGVTTESYDKNRGKLGVIDSLATRMENVKKTGFADEIIIEEYVGQKVIDVQRYNVDIFAIGSDWVGKFDYLNEYCKVVYLERTKNISSTDLRKIKYAVQRVGIIGNGRIANRFVVEAKFVSGTNVQNVYNPRLESAKRFADKWDMTPFDDLEKFYEMTDLVYIASPHGTHYEYIKSALEHKKHVLCEKPMVLKKSQAEELFNYAQKNNLVLFEGIKTAYCPGFNKLLGIARSGKIGNIRNIEACFTKLENKNRRELTDLNFGGSFLELGSYVVFPMLKLFGANFKNISFETITADNGLDIFTKVSMSFPGGLATATCGLGVKSEGRLLISGTEGYIVVAPPWWKTTEFEIHYEDPNIVEKYNENFFGDGLRYELSDMLYLINGIEKNSFKLTAKDSIALAEIMENFLTAERQQNLDWRSDYL
ncbi:MAG: Gfo/Idh/MocA family oxidoreductase [Quinella sp. 3Q1]|nr:Gfo/Idh/MocA family oxidoreductase [Quinella sp. 3Q1]MBR6887193.1 Gfo/Idh/MocA family oxidoreductase [Selenomonadaceae bacterium]